MGRGKVFPEYETVLKEKKKCKLKIKKNIVVFFTVLFIVKINYAQTQRIRKSNIIDNILNYSSGLNR